MTSVTLWHISSFSCNVKHLAYSRLFERVVVIRFYFMEVYKQLTLEFRFAHWEVVGSSVKWNKHRIKKIHSAALNIAKVYGWNECLKCFIKINCIQIALTSHALIDPEAQSAFCASPSSSPSYLTDTSRTEKATSPKHQQAQKSEKRIAQKRKVSSSSEDWINVRLPVLTSLQGERLDCHCRHDCAVLLSETERERDWSCGISAHCSGGESEWARIGARADDGSGWEGNGIIYHSLV